MIAYKCGNFYDERSPWQGFIHFKYIRLELVSDDIKKRPAKLNSTHCPKDRFGEGFVVSKLRRPVVLKVHVNI